MAIILLSRGSYSWGSQIAGMVADKLGYDCISREDILKASGQFDLPEIKLIKAFNEMPSLIDRFIGSKKEEYLSYLRAAILKNVQQDNVVAHGFAGLFLIHNISHVVKVRITIDQKDRIALAQEEGGMGAGDAFRALKKIDAQRQRWGQYMFGVDLSDSSNYHMTFHVNEQTINDAVELISYAAGLNRYRTTIESQKSLDDQLLASEVKVALLRIRPDAVINADSGLVYVETRENGMDTNDIKHMISSTAFKVIGVKQVEVNIEPSSA